MSCVFEVQCTYSDGNKDCSLETGVSIHSRSKSYRLAGTCTCAVVEMTYWARSSQSFKCVCRCTGNRRAELFIDLSPPGPAAVDTVEISWLP
jgi:hypothetical protein